MQKTWLSSPKTGFLAMLLILSALFSLYSQRNYLFKQSNYRSLEKKFNQSQWRNPTSTTPIDDNTLYHYAAFYLIKGGNPFIVNPEVPPLGKYLYGASILIFKNPYVLSFLLYLSLLALVGLTTYELTRSVNLALLAALILSLVKLLNYQLTQTMLDLPLVTFLLLHLFANLKLIDIESKRRVFWILVSALGLGLFAGSKFPLFVPAVIISDSYLFFKHKRLKDWLITTILGGGVFLLGYAKAFYDQPSPIRLAKDILWSVHFYSISKLPLTPFQWLPAVYFKKYYSPSHQAYVSPDHWQWLWPILFTGFFILTAVYLLKVLTKNKTLKLKKKKKVSINYLLLTTYLLLFVLSLVNFWERYLLLVVPLATISLFTLVHLFLYKKNQLLL